MLRELDPQPKDKKKMSILLQLIVNTLNHVHNMVAKLGDGVCLSAYFVAETIKQSVRGNMGGGRVRLLLNVVDRF
jgi:hypothetical protein